ncbi:molybdopterin dehydrogenase FAD-binding [Paenibacillus curdlanolyticus YK9]|uniref:Molybdopterin dehydrogenase FAD-binding n=1 Tax=Paenibacillus curdlanolyticus YK9 TaxID=717606 RepID=E0IDR0_9BACL|nr:FAD binding domain-containing protein [Paenibacillus curdlanolyticus]EFM09264.1 molybdopterin dehydrogenase FAD-binding [Paenibacillus curdlanolyticus YK9]
MASLERDVPAYAAVKVWRPHTAEEAWRLKRQFGAAARYAAGGTWLRTRWESGAAMMPLHLISLEQIADMRGVQQIELASIGEPQSSFLRIGAITSLAQLMESPLVTGVAPLLQEAARSIAAPSIRQLATVGGNVLTRSGDLIPALAALDAQLVLCTGSGANGGRHSGGYERQPLIEWLAASGNDSDSSVVVAVDIAAEPRSKPYWFRKIGRRESFSPSVITAAGTFGIDATGRLDDVRIVVSGTGMPAVRLYDAETAAEQGAYGMALYAAVRAGVPSVSDDFAGSAYRRMAAANMIASELDAAVRSIAAVGEVSADG